MTHDVMMMPLMCDAKTHRSDNERVTQDRSEEHTSELQSQSNLVCRLLLEKKNIPTITLTAPVGMPRPKPLLLVPPPASNASPTHRPTSARRRLSPFVTRSCAVTCTICRSA